MIPELEVSVVVSVVVVAAEVVVLAAAARGRNSSIRNSRCTFAGRSCSSSDNHRNSSSKCSRSGTLCNI